MRHEGQHHVCPAPLRLIFQTGSGENIQMIDNASKALAQDESLEVCDNGFPFVVVGIREMLEREAIR
jgi:hypothetical protein